MAAGGKCRVSHNGPHIGIAHDIKLTEEGKNIKYIQANKKNLLHQHLIMMK